MEIDSLILETHVKSAERGISLILISKVYIFINLSEATKLN